jgi:hypothetical protein
VSSDIASWLDAVATVGLLGAAIVAGVQAKRLYDAGVERELRQHATQVSAWTAVRNSPSGGEFGLCLRNDSSVPVTSVDVWTSNRKHPGEELGPQRYTTLVPGYFFALTRARRDGFGFFDRPVHVGDRDGHLLVPTSLSPDSAQVTRFRFVDSNGVRWERRMGGGLHRVEEEPSAGEK